MRWIVSLVIVVGLCVPLSAYGSPSRPDAVLSSIVDEALAQTSVHWTQDVFNGRGHRRWISDVNTRSGKQWGYFDFPFAGGKVQEWLVNGVVYIRGNAAGLRDAIPLNKAQAARGAGKWILIPRRDAFYGETSDGLTLASIVGDETASGDLKVVKTTVDGTRLIAVQEQGGWEASLAAPASGAPLPLTFDEVLEPGVTLHGTFSKWNAAVKVVAPARSTPISKVRSG
ncbi:MAG: hypothetical protein QOG85_711 [Gaiellaceae bacterium]|nr:hypothetical protein [Gaiellaceae bacterium]